MHLTKPVGRAAAARKNDILTALGAYALAQAKGPQRLILRLMTLITARYNWTRDERAVGQREIARLWSCDERTVKREMAKLRGMGWLVVRRQGVRGRVTEYALSIDTILSTTQAQWEAVGPDFALRMEGVPEATIVPLRVTGHVPPPDLSSGTEWALTQAILHSEDPPPCMPPGCGRWRVQTGREASDAVRTQPVSCGLYRNPSQDPPSDSMSVGRRQHLGNRLPV